MHEEANKETNNQQSNVLEIMEANKNKQLNKPANQQTDLFPNNNLIQPKIEQNSKSVPFEVIIFYLKLNNF